MYENIINWIKDIFSPKRCIWCKIPNFFICPDCLKKTNEYEPICYICKKPSDDFLLHHRCKHHSNIHFLDKIIVLTHYSSHNIQTLIKHAKYYWETDILDDFWIYLAKKLYKYQQIENKDEYILLTPPMFFFRKWKRQYNHGEILTRVVSKISSIPFSFKVLKKIKFTQQQSKMHGIQRFHNIKNSFIVRKNFIPMIEGKKVIVIDDVISTGTTLDELAKVLKQNGAVSVIGLVIASD